jgi:multidrug efflux pump subunit AcrB
MNADNQFPILGLCCSCCNESSALGRRTGIFFAGVLGTAVLFICAVLVLLFANFLHPVTIMATLPLSLGGALLFGKPMYEARLDSGVGRLRPILMTTIAMIAGMVPIALGIGAVGKLSARWRWR